MGTKPLGSIAAQVAELIKEQNVSVLQLSDRTGIARTTLQTRLAGIKPFSVPELEAIADSLNVPIVSFFEAA
jgi:transcriptional regulator with XRE-family HTH domain